VSAAAAQRNGIGASRAGSVLEPVARQLYDALTDGCELPLRWNIRNGYCLRDGTTRKPVAGSYTAEWRLARDVLPDGSQLERRANPYFLLQHLRGRCNVAIQTPSWSSLIILDIDRHVPEYADPEERFEAELRAIAQRDEVLSSVWRAYEFSAERQPVILLTPGGGYHVYLPLDRPWPWPTRGSGTSTTSTRSGSACARGPSSCTRPACPCARRAAGKQPSSYLATLTTQTTSS
jgi:hypothetical protein